MAPMNIEPMTTFRDGSLLLLSTQYVGDANFRCELYVSTTGYKEQADLRMVSGYSVEASTCREAQERAYVYAVRLYPDAASQMKKPPYLIWHGPTPVEIDRSRRSFDRRR
jgi:hypothetical protein